MTRGVDCLDRRYLPATEDSRPARLAELRAEVAEFIVVLVSHAALDAGRCVGAHAGLPEPHQNRTSGAVCSFALHGGTTGETYEFGFPARPSTVESVRLDPELKALLAQRAEEEGVAVSQVIREALRHHLEAS